MARVFSLQYEEPPLVDTFVGTMLISSVEAYMLVDTGATHACISEQFMSVRGLIPVVLTDCVYKYSFRSKFCVI